MWFLYVFATNMASLKQSYKGTKKKKITKLFFLIEQQTGCISYVLLHPQFSGWKLWAFITSQLLWFRSLMELGWVFWLRTSHRLLWAVVSLQAQLGNVLLPHLFVCQLAGFSSQAVLKSEVWKSPGPHWLLGFVLRGFSIGQLTAWQLVSLSQEDSKLKREITVVLGLKHWSNIPSPLLYSVY